LSLKKQIHIYSVDTSAFYNKEEFRIHKHLGKLYRYKFDLHKKRDKLKGKNEDLKIYYTKHISNANKMIKKLKDKLYIEFNKNNSIRNLIPATLNKRKIISVFDSVLTRTMQIPEDTLSTDIMIVQTFFFDIIEDIILDGFMYGKEKYVCLTASAGQIRTKKTVFIKESSLKKYQNTLMCGLTIEKINELGGVNVNKYLAYLALSNSATDIWGNFDIKKSIVVEDMETTVRGLVDFIDDDTYKIERKEMEILISHTDGCGMYLPSVNRKSMMVRLPWIKGLLVPFYYDKFVKEANKNSDDKKYGIVKDIYGKYHDILKEGIEVIFTKSQFKMYKYYKDWEQYTDNYIKYNCQAGMCNEEEDIIGNAKINYQMLQTLTCMTDEELETVAEQTKYNIINIGKDRKTMLKVLGVTKSNTNKNYIQQALEIYPELLNDTYSKEILKQVKKSMVNSARAGKLDINGKYTFIIPDMYAFCEYLIKGDLNPVGLLADGEIYCNLYKSESRLACLRSPHLYREWAIRNNIIDKKKNKWFITKGLYTSCHDLISKILQFDVDGDKSLVVADHTLIKVGERNMEDIVPLYYNMRKAPAELIDNNSIYKGLKTAYTGGNIGMVSNNITKIWNSNNVNLNAIRLLCMENNFTIDFAKTLYKPERPNEQKTIINSYTKAKTPHFFIYAKKKEKDKVEKINNSVVNKLEKIIPNPNINFNADNLGKFNYKMLMHNKKIELDSIITKKYSELDLKSHFMITKISDDEIGNSVYLYKEIRKKLLEINNDEKYVVDVLIEYLYVHKKYNYKTTLWECFGDIIIENLKKNIADNSVLCERCGVRIEKINNKIMYCCKCAKEIEKENGKIRFKKWYDKQKSNEIENH